MLVGGSVILIWFCRLFDLVCYGCVCVTVADCFWCSFGFVLFCFVRCVCAGFRVWVGFIGWLFLFGGCLL